MQNQSIQIAICAAVIPLCVGFAEGDWTTYDFPGADSTIITDIEGDTLVGIYGDKYFTSVHGFIYDGTNWTTLDAPGAEGTSIYNIEDGNVYGGYSNYNGSSYSGSACMYDGSNWTTLYSPTSGTATILDVEGDVMVGVWQDYESYNGGGIIYDGSSWTELNLPESYGYGVAGVTGVEGGVFVGCYTGELNYSKESVDWGNSGIVGYGSQMYGFIYDGGNWTAIDIPGAINTWAWAIDSGKIVGSYEDSSLVSHGFVYEDGNLTIIDLPGAKHININGITGNYLVGNYQDEVDGGVHGFVYEIPEPATFLLWAFGGVILLKNEVRFSSTAKHTKA